MLAVLLGFLLFCVNSKVILDAKGEQRVTLKFLVHSGCTPIQAWRKLHDVWGDRTLSKTQTRFWYKKFREGQEEIADVPRPGRPRSQCTAKNIWMVSEILEGNRTLSLRNLSDMTGISTHTLNQIIKKDLNMRRRTPKFVPKELTPVQQWTRWALARDNLELVTSQDDPDAFLHRIVTGDETWLSTFETDTKQNSWQWTTPEEKRPKKPQRIDGVKKVVMTLFFDWKGVVLIDFLKPKETIDSPQYCRTLTKLKEALRRKCPELCEDCLFILHHDNASPHMSDFTMERIHKWNIKILEHPANSPDLAPCDFSIFPKLKAKLRGVRFQNLQSLKDQAKETLMSFDKSVFDDAIYEMVLRWQKCEVVNGDYFEGDGVQIDPLFEKTSGDMSEEEGDDSQCEEHNGSDSVSDSD